MLYYRQVPNLSQTNLNEIYASQTASVERGGHPDMEFLHTAKQSHGSSGWLRVCSVWDLLELGRCRVARTAIHTPECHYFLCRGALLDGILQTPAGMCTQIDLNGQLLSCQREKGAGLCNHPFCTAVRTELKRSCWHITSLRTLA